MPFGGISEVHDRPSSTRSGTWSECWRWTSRCESGPIRPTCRCWQRTHLFIRQLNAASLQGHPTHRRVGTALGPRLVHGVVRETTKTDTANQFTAVLLSRRPSRESGCAGYVVGALVRSPGYGPPTAPGLVDPPGSRGLVGSQRSRAAAGAFERGMVSASGGT